MSHTSTPYEVRHDRHGLWVDQKNGTNPICMITSGTTATPKETADAEFIAMACNAHDELVAALKALHHAVCGETGFANAVRTHLSKRIEAITVLLQHPLDKGLRVDLRSMFLLWSDELAEGRS